jgi:hypothetical protein
MRAVTVATREGKPEHFIYKRQKMLASEIADHWREMGRWWEAETARDFFLITTVGGPFLLCHDCQMDLWYAKPVQ